MKIVYGVFCGESYGGGVGEVAFEMAEAASKENQVLLVHTGPRTRIKKINSNYSRLIIGSISEGEVFIPRFSPENLKYLFSRLDKFNPEVVHVHDNGPLSFLLQVWAVRRNVPCLNTLHLLPTKAGDFGAKEVSKGLGRLADLDLTRKYLLLFLNNCDALIALNQEAEKDARKFGYKGRCFLIPNGRNLNWYGKKSPPRITLEEKKLIYIGHLCLRKNQKFLLQALRYLPRNYSLDLLGGYFEKRYLDLLKSIKGKYGLKVNFLGKVSHSQVPQYLGKSHLFVSASEMEVQSLVVMEALASGTPVVGLSNETIDEFVDNTVGARLSKRAKPAEFAKEIEKICSLSQKEYSWLCQGAKKKVAAFDWSQVISKTVAVYQEVIKEKRLMGGKNRESALFSDLKTLATLLDSEVGTNTQRRINEFEKKLVMVFDKNYLYVFLVLIIAFFGRSLLELSKNLKEFKETLTS